MGSPTASTSTSPIAPTGAGDDPPRKPPRKLKRSADQLHRNQACLTCRRRRIKCDAARPHCSSCVRSFRFLARTQPDPERDARGVQCVFENNEPEEPEEEDPRAAVAKLEARVAELQGELDRLTSRSPSIATTPVFGQTQPMTPVRTERHLSSPSISQHTSPQMPQHLFAQPHLWPSMDLDPTSQHFGAPSYDPGFPYGATGLPPLHPHGVQSTSATSPVSAGPDGMSWAGQGGPSMPQASFHMPDGNPLGLELETHVGDAMSRYVEMSMGMGGAERPTDERPPTGRSD
ncbi:hypothetical protein CC85DRAFT_326494 [Cutaneotrichosporon oleaginosum]|uniref:Zn(2)-C6 fungal-type domain-containing protein n=1 Tax=Cutaneotrichosporon oleaginosum TaxID=879819 RepID=A0A0J1B968_9TREE|nr:uncharacterized protein CC85DRAFT_326494 [Cutaneotrichosporon oleaginosum]KLT44349.1 hypothetical protein CC85DRAFT_326494 [Cutaneotrichosporon oleaginosum]TXT07925.1 hypothetical protein COLE_04849 [Cutaneotrichosporon oleaginosum]